MTIRTSTQRVVRWVAVAALVAGCVEKRVHWSPDGRVAAVIGADGLYLCDPQGRLSPRVAENVARVEWFADAQRLLMVRRVECPTWESAAARLPAEQRERVAAAAGRTREELLAFEGSLEDYEPAAKAELTDGELVAAFVCLRDRYADELRPRVGEKWDELAKLRVTVHTLQVLAVRDGAGEPGAELLSGLDDVVNPRISPDGRHVAFVTAMSTATGDARRLMVLPIEGGAAPRTVADLVGSHADWSADGRYLVYAYASVPPPSGGDALRLGAVARRGVRDAGGALLAEFEKPEDLAGVVFDDLLKVRCLRDGRVLFSSGDFRLPATKKEMPERQTLFTVDLDAPATVARLLPAQSEAKLPSGASFFELNPAQTRLAVPGDDGSVAIVTLATGDVQSVRPEDAASDKLRTVPSWRTDDELCFAVGPGSSFSSAERAEIVLWSPAGVRTISRDWPEAVVKDLLIPDASRRQTVVEEAAPAEPAD